jgi:TonB family protein
MNKPISTCSNQSFQAIGLFLLIGVSCRADLTLRYTVDIKKGSATPTAEKVIRIKGDRTLSNIGTLTAIEDDARAEVALLNPATKQYARTSLVDYGAAVQAATRLSPAAQQALANPDDLDRIPGLRQYADHAQRALAVLNATDEIQNLFSRMPGAGEKMRAVTADLTKNAARLPVKIQEALYLPFTKPNAPVMEIHVDLASISSDPIDDSLFDVPSDYRMAPVSELIAALKPGVVQLPKDLDPGEQISRVGGRVSLPSVIAKRSPEYTEEARRAKLAGTVILSIVVDTEGIARDIRVVQSLGMGLDEKAIDAVRHWKFKPGQKAGQPVNVRATVEINFKLRDDPPQQ